MTLAQRFAHITDTIPDHVQLIAVSKTRAPDEIKSLIALGQHDFGENYLQEALPKIHSLSSLPCTWHYIGAIQSNKTQQIAEHFHWVHTLDSYKHARRLSDARLALAMPPLQCCIQINSDHEDSKAGITIEECEALCQRLQSLSGLQLRGLMCIPNPKLNTEHAYQSMQQLLATLNAKGFKLDTLSMGMSGDYLTAINSGATCVRIGSALFGERNA